MNWRNALLVSAVVLAAAGVAAAQTQMPQDQNPATVAGAMETKSVTGTVVSSTADSLVIDTASGRQTFTVDASSTVPSGLMAGARVTVAYHSLSGGGMHAATVTTLAPSTGSMTAGSTTAAPAPTAQTTEPTTDTSLPEPAPADTASTTSRELPRTASNLPALGLLGLFALGGALALRFARHRA